MLMAEKAINKHMKQTHCGLQIGSYTRFIVQSQNNFPCSYYFLLQTTAISAAWRVKKEKKGHSYIRKFYPFPLIAFDFIWLQALGHPQIKRLCTGMTRRRKVCLEIAAFCLNTGISTCLLLTRCFSRCCPLGLKSISPE